MIDRNKEVFWKGENVVTAPNLPGNILRVGFNIVPIWVSPEAFHPDIHNNPTQFSISIRSRFAQLGIGARSDSIKRLLHSLEHPGVNSATRGFESEIMIINHSTREIEIPPNVGLYRIFRPNAPLEGPQFYDLVNNQIIIDGKKGVEWEYEYDHSGVEKGLRVLIEPERFWIPSAEKDLPPILINTANNHFKERYEIDTLFRPIPRTARKILWIGQTPHIKLAPDIEAVLDPNVYPEKGKEINWRKLGHHIDSHLIDGGSDWPIRVEVYSPTKSSSIPNYVLFTFYNSSDR